jgi:hypothetical protein
MKKTLSNFIVLQIIALIFSNCNNTVQIGKAVKGINTIGNWYQETTKNIGGFQITGKTNLTILKNSDGVFEYKTETTVIDDMYGGLPRTEYSNGRLKENVKDNEWLFLGGEYGNRGGYIEVPSDRWDDYKPSSLTIQFATGHGNSMTFVRRKSKIENYSDPSFTETIINEEIADLENSFDGGYSFEDNSAKLNIIVDGNSWSGKTIIISGFGAEYDNQNAIYDNGVVKGSDLYESSGMIKIGQIKGNFLMTSVGGKHVTLSK